MFQPALDPLFLNNIIPLRTPPTMISGTMTNISSGSSNNSFGSTTPLPNVCFFILVLVFNLCLINLFLRPSSEIQLWIPTRRIELECMSQHTETQWWILVKHVSLIFHQICLFLIFNFSEKKFQMFYNFFVTIF